MSTAPDFLDLPWCWQISGGRQMLVTDGGGAMVVLSGAYTSPIWTRDLQTGTMRSISANDDIAKIIAAAPDVRRHARALLNGINLGFLDISDEAEPSFRAVVNALREALARSGAG